MEGEIIMPRCPPLHLYSTFISPSYPSARAHKNGQLEEECATQIEARSPGKIIEPY